MMSKIHPSKEGNVISEDEFGRIFEAGMQARKDGRPRTPEPYRDQDRQLAFRDGWDAEDARIKNPDLQ